MQAEKVKTPNAFLTIVKLLLKSSILGIERMAKKKKDRKSSLKSAIVLIVVLFGLLYALIVVPVINVVYQISPIVFDKGLFNEFLTFLYTISGVMVLFFSVITMLSMLYFSRDTEFFLALPVKPSTIFAAKLFVVYVTELLIEVLIMLPLLVAAGIAVNMGAFYYIVSLVGVFIAPALPLLLASILSIPLMYIVGFFKNKGALTSIIVILLFGVFFAAYFYFIMGMNTSAATDPTAPADVANGSLEAYYITLVESMSGVLVRLANVVYPLLALSRLSTLTTIGSLSVGVSALINLLIVVGFVAALCVLVVLISGSIYKRGASAQLESANVVKKTKGKFEGGSMLKAMCIKEWRELIRTPSFAYQCLMSIVMTPLLVAVFSFSPIRESMLNAQDNSDRLGELFVAILFGMILMFGAGTNYGSSSAITREGKTFAYSKFLPVPYKTQITAKLIVNMAISAVAGIVSLVITAIATGSFASIAFALVGYLLFSYGYIAFCIHFDLKKPKLDWTLPNEAVKHNFRIVLPYFMNMLISPIMVTLLVLPILLMPSFIAGLLVGWLVFIVISAALASLFHYRLFASCDKLYDKLTI